MHCLLAAPPILLPSSDKRIQQCQSYGLPVHSSCAARASFALDKECLFISVLFILCKQQKDPRIFACNCIFVYRRAIMADCILASLLLPAAIVLDCLFSEPPVQWHPVVYMGRLASMLEDVLYKKASLSLLPQNTALFLSGSIAALIHILAWSLPVFFITAFLAGLHPVAGFSFAAICLWLCMAPRSLAEHATAVLRPLCRHDLPKARTMLSRIVGRNTKTLDAHGIARACVESVAENCTDSTLATLFWGAAGFLLAGFPGAAALAVAQRSANTLDAMWGHKSAYWLYFGRTAARLDDCFNCLPARLSLLCISLAALFVPGTSARQAFKAGIQYHAAHESPNSAWSEAAFAGALSLRLGGPASYPGIYVDHPWLGNGTPSATERHISLAIRLMWGTVWTGAILLGTILLIA